MFYEVIRPFPPRTPQHKPGDVLTVDAFRSAQRIEQLVSSRYIQPRATGVSEVQPTSPVLLNATIRQLRNLVGQVVDAGVLEAALAKETRETAIPILAKRLEELNDESTE